jgi:tryptophan 2,3-dioxygenase
MTGSPGPTYWDYLKLDRLLTLQGGLEGDEDQLMPDELHFIIVHQVYELWFKLILRELRVARNRLAAPTVPEESVPYVVHHLRRVTEILELAVQQWAVMETLTPQDFLAFRDKLLPASGFQSFQMREVEIVLGLSDADRPRYGDVEPVAHILEKAAGSAGGELAVRRLQAARSEKSLRNVLHDWLYRTPIQGSGPDDPGDAGIVAEFLDQYLQAYLELQTQQEERLLANGIGNAESLRTRFEESAKQARRFLFCEDVAADVRDRSMRTRAGLLFIESYRQLPLLAWPRLLIDSVVEVEEQFVLWRNRHARMTERTIGRRIGTGGSSGVDYLDKAASGRIYPELWAVRTLLLPVHRLPALQRAEFYGFAT